MLTAFRTSFELMIAEIFRSRRTLGDRVNVDAVVPQRRKHLAADAGVGLHVVADESEDREAVLDLERLDLARRLFRIQIHYRQLFWRDSPNLSSIATQIECSDELCVIRMTLICARGQSVEKPFGKSGNADHPAAFEA